MQMPEVIFKPQFVSLVNSSHSVIKLGRMTRMRGEITAAYTDQRLLQKKKANLVHVWTL